MTRLNWQCTTDEEYQGTQYTVHEAMCGFDLIDVGLDTIHDRKTTTVDSILVSINGEPSRSIRHLLVNYDFSSVANALNAVENLYFELYPSPMSLLSIALSKPNPDFRLPFKQGAFSFYYEAKYKNHLVSVWVETRSDCLKLHRSEVMTFSREGQLSSRTEGPAGLDFHTLQDALDYVSHWYADTYLSPMDLLGLGLSVKDNPRKPKYVPTRLSRGSR